MKEIVLDYWSKDDFFTHFSQTFEGKLINENTIEIDNWFGKGYINHHAIEDDFMVMSMELEVFDKLIIKRPESDRNYIAIRFFITDNNLLLVDKKSDQPFNSMHSIMASTPSLGLHIDLQKGMKLKYVVLVFSSNWIKPKITDNSCSNFKRLLISNQPFHCFSSINYEIFKLINQITKAPHTGNPWSDLKIKASSFGLLFSTIKKFSEIDLHNCEYSKNDLSKVLDIKKTLHNCDFQSPPKLEVLSQNSSMCVSKLSRIFKSVIGKTIFQYYHDLKMEKAMSLLKSNEYSITDTAYILGYHNISKFSSAFKKHYNLTPSQVSTNMTI